MEIDDLKPGIKVMCIRTYGSYTKRGDISIVRNVDKLGQEGGEIRVDNHTWVWEGRDRFDSIFAIVDFRVYINKLNDFTKPSKILRNNMP